MWSKKIQWLKFEIFKIVDFFAFLIVLISQLDGDVFAGKALNQIQNSVNKKIIIYNELLLS